MHSSCACCRTPAGRRRQRSHSRRPCLGSRHNLAGVPFHGPSRAPRAQRRPRCCCTSRRRRQRRYATCNAGHEAWVLAGPRPSCTVQCSLEHSGILVLHSKPRVVQGSSEAPGAAEAPLEERPAPRSGPLSLCSGEPGRAAALMRLWAQHGITPEVVAAAGPPVVVEVGPELPCPAEQVSMQSTLVVDSARCIGSTGRTGHDVMSAADCLHSLGVACNGDASHSPPLPTVPCSCCGCLGPLATEPA